MANLVNDAARCRSWTASLKTYTYGAKLGAFNLHDMACLGIFPSSLAHLRETLLKLARGGTYGAKKPFRRLSKIMKGTIHGTQTH